MSKRKSKAGRTVVFEPVRCGEGSVCSMCGDPVKRAVRIHIAGFDVAHFICRPCIRRAARTADFKPIATFTTVVVGVGAIARHEEKKP